MCTRVLLVVAVCLFSVEAFAQDGNAPKAEHTPPSLPTPAAPNADGVDWGEWDDDPSPTQSTYGVGLSGADERALNALDKSNLMDYDLKKVPPSPPPKKPLEREEQDLLDDIEKQLLENLERELMEGLNQ